MDPEEPSLGRIRADAVAPPHNPTSIKRCIARVEKNPELAFAYLFADTSCDTPLKEGHLSILRRDGPGSSPNVPMAVVQVKAPSIPDGKYLIKNRIMNIYWSTSHSSITIQKVHFYPNITLEVARAKANSFLHVNEPFSQKKKYSKKGLINFRFQSGISRMIPMVTSSWHHLILLPRGLVPKLLGLLYRFRGDWSSQIPSLTSELDSNFPDKEIQRHWSYYFFQSHYGHKFSESSSAYGATNQE